MQRQKDYQVIANFRRWIVTQAEVDACKRIRTNLGEVLYAFATGSSAKPQINIVRYNPVLGRIVCTCKDGIAPTCWHRRAASVVEREHAKTARAKLGNTQQ